MDLSRQIAISQSDVAKRVIWVAVNCLLKLLNRFLQRVGSSLVPEITSTQIELVGFGIRSILLIKSLFFFARQSQPKLLRDLPRNGLLNREHVRDFALILLTPKLCTRRRINQVHLNVQRISHLT